MEDNLCMAKVLQVPESSLPDCESADQKCWSVFWFKLNSNDESFFDHRKIGRGNGHKKKNIYNHKTLGRGDGQKK
jgi:hypothetical protein